MLQRFLSLRTLQWAFVPMDWVAVAYRNGFISMFDAFSHLILTTAGT